jgi:DNA-binding transcriptional regulator GbsR (MarR family)
LYLNGDEPLSLDEITNRLKVSKGNVSVNIRILENWGAVTKVWVKGSRKDHYKANLDIEKIIFGKIKQAVTKRLDEVSHMIEEFKSIVSSGQKEFSPEEKTIAKIYLDRLEKIERLKNMAGKYLSIANTIFQ